MSFICNVVMLSLGDGFKFGIREPKQMFLWIVIRIKEVVKISIYISQLVL